MVRVYTELNRFPSKFNVQETGVALPQMTRAGVLFDRATAHDIVKIGQALDHYTRPGDNVLFFPNEAAYYFLFNRSVPTRYVHAYFAVTTDQRREMVNELEQSRPAYVIYTLNSWRIDDIPEYIQGIRKPVGSKKHPRQTHQIERYKNLPYLQGSRFLDFQNPMQLLLKGSVEYRASQIHAM